MAIASFLQGPSFGTLLRFWHAWHAWHTPGTLGTVIKFTGVPGVPGVPKSNSVPLFGTITGPLRVLESLRNGFSPSYVSSMDTV